MLAGAATVGSMAVRCIADEPRPEIFGRDERSEHQFYEPKTALLTISNLCVGTRIYVALAYEDGARNDGYQFVNRIATSSVEEIELPKNENLIFRNRGICRETGWFIQNTELRFSLDKDMQLGLARIHDRY